MGFVMDRLMNMPSFIFFSSLRRTVLSTEARYAACDIVMSQAA
jgi:hypothetical protein